MASRGDPPHKFRTPTELSDDRGNERKGDEKRIRKQAYPPEFKGQAAKRAEAVGRIGHTADEFGLVEKTLRNRAKAAKAGKLNPAGDKQIGPEQM